MSAPGSSGEIAAVVPVAYQGGKTRLAQVIVDHWWPADGLFYDLCCGSGAITIEMLNRGASVDECVMVDAGPWGAFWFEIGAGIFDFDVLCAYIEGMPSDLSLVGPWLKELSGQSALIDTTEVFILLQAGSFGGKAIWIEDGKWKNNTFRNYWTPTTTSSRRSPVNPMMPMPDTLKDRVWRCMTTMHGIEAHCADVRLFDVEDGSTVYLDPPYLGTTAYGHTFDVDEELKRLSQRSTVYVSEGRQVGEHGVMLHAGRSKGGISGDRKVKANEEWLSWTLPTLSGSPKEGPDGR